MVKLRKLLGRKWLNYIAIIISAFTLIAFIYQTSVISQQQHMSVYPHLMLNNEYGGSLKYSYIITNKGVGPAIIDHLRVTTGDGKMYDDLGLYLMDTIPEKYHNDFLISNITEGQLISPGEKIELITINHDRGFENSQDSVIASNKVDPIMFSNKLYALINDENLLIEVAYRSVYDHEWKITNRTKIPEEL